MSETPNATQKNAEQADLSSSAPRPKLKKLWGCLCAFLDYVDEEVPAPPKADAPESGLKKAWASFNAFLDSLDAPDPEPAASGVKEEGCGNPPGRPGALCRNVIFHVLVVVLLFGLALFAMTAAMSFVRDRQVPFCPSDEVLRYLTAEHEALEAVADSLPAGKDRSDEIPLGLFGEQCAGTLKPVRIYSDEYGVYLMTSKSGYVGENGIFIARDAERLPEDLSWWLISGRVFAYAFFE